MTDLSKFQPGQIYATRSICDHNCIYRFKVTRRTAKTIYFVSCTPAGTAHAHEKERSRRIKVNSDGIERIMPHGSYSMAAVLAADDLVQEAA